MADNNEFREFIIEQLRIAKINQEYREAFTDPEGMKMFLAVVTHPTHDAETNYEEFEFVGDGIIKGILSQYIPRRFPKMAGGESKYSKKGTGEGVLSKTRRFLEQRKTLSDFALERGFWDYVRADADILEKSRKETLEDVFEAFVGALTEIVDQRVKRGLGYNYAYNYVEASLNNMEIEISKKTLDDPITRLNELYKANQLKNDQPPLKWGDAAYTTIPMYLPKLAHKPSGAGVGAVFFSTSDKAPLIWNGKDWVRIGKAPLMELYPLDIGGPPLSEEERREQQQLIWYAGVYGFPQRLGNTHLLPLGNISPKKIISHPEHYGATIIGQGMAFKKADAKKMAANQALEYLSRMGYKK